MGGSVEWGLVCERVGGLVVVLVWGCGVGVAARDGLGVGVGGVCALGAGPLAPAGRLVGGGTAGVYPITWNNPQIQPPVKPPVKPRSNPGQTPVKPPVKPRSNPGKTAHLGAELVLPRLAQRALAAAVHVGAHAGAVPNLVLRGDWGGGGVVSGGCHRCVWGVLGGCRRCAWG